MTPKAVVIIMVTKTKSLQARKAKCSPTELCRDHNLAILKVINPGFWISTKTLRMIT